MHPISLRLQSNVFLDEQSKQTTQQMYLPRADAYHLECSICTCWDIVPSVHPPTGTPPGHIPHSFVGDYISRATIPVLSVAMSTTKVRFYVLVAVVRHKKSVQLNASSGYCRPFTTHICTPCERPFLLSLQAMQKLEGFTSKMNVKDHVRTLNVIDHYEPFIDFDALLRCASIPPRPPG